jgi:Zn-dependent metalloprotease
MRFIVMVMIVTLFQSAFALKPVATNPLETAPTWSDQSGVWRTDANKVVDTRDGSIQCVSQLAEGPFSGSPEDAARSFLMAHPEWMKDAASLSMLKAVRTVESPMGYHVTFELTLNDVPFYPGNLVVTLDHQKIVRFFFSSLFAPAPVTSLTPALSADQAVKIATGYLHPKSEPRDAAQTKLVIWAGDNRDYTLCWRVWQYLENPMGDWEVLVDAQSGMIRRVHDQACYVDGTGKVFLPDPLTSGSANYGETGYSDNSNANSAQLAAQQVVDTLRGITLSGSVYRLQGPFVTLVDFESPTVAPITATHPDSFRFTRNLNAFEDVNVYYNVDKSQRWIQSLGFTNIQNLSINVDPHGLSGADNSHYIPSTNRIAWGDGGVDDAEDADVIWHEYGHAIQTGSVPGWGGGDEGGMGEGFGDYWTASYSHSISTFHESWVFNWDGHNEFWAGRVVNGNMHYPEDNGEVHDAGEIWSQPCFETMLDITRPIMDRIVLQHHFLLGTSASMPTAAQALLTVDQNLYGGIHQSFMYTHFIPRGLLTAPPVFGLTSPIGGEFWPIDSTVSVQWTTGNLGGNVMIELSRNGIAGPWSVLTASVSNNGLANLTAAGPRSTNCRVRISVVGDPAHIDTSSADFTISGLQLLLSEDFESGAPSWTHSSAGGSWIDQWHLSTRRSRSSSHSYKCGDTGTAVYGNLNDARLVSPIINALPAGTVFSYDQWIWAEFSTAYPDSAYDGGIVEISANGGAFTRIAPLSGYTKYFRIRTTGGNPVTGPMPGQPCFSGVDTLTWSKKTFDLSSYAGQSVQLRFRFGSDAGTGREGWYLDNVLVYAPATNPPLIDPDSLTITFDGVNVILDWAADANPGYRIYSSVTVEGPYDTLEGTTTDHFFTLPDRADERRFYRVVGWDGQ